MSNGKGSKRRPKNVDYQTWEKNYERIFGKKTIKSKKLSKK